MPSKGFRKIGFAALLCGVVGSSGLGGCAAERDPINRVQSNAIPKSFFVGAKLNDSSDDPEFYSRSMVVDVPYGESGADWGLFTNTINSANRWYADRRDDPHALRLPPGVRIDVPTGIAMFPGEAQLVPPRSIVERCYRIVRWTDMPRGGHFPALEEPGLLIDDIRAFFRPLR